MEPLPLPTVHDWQPVVDAIAALLRPTTPEEEIHAHMTELRRAIRCMGPLSRDAGARVVGQMDSTEVRSRGDCFR
jgi:hypothetical protein